MTTASYSGRISFARRPPARESLADDAAEQACFRPEPDVNSSSSRSGVTMTHPDGGPDLALNLNPERAKAPAGFDYFSIGAPDRDSIEALATHLSNLGEFHAGVHFATIGWILPMLHVPDVHEVRFYTMESHTDIDPAAPLVIDDAMATAQAKEEQWRADGTESSGVAEDAP